VVQSDLEASIELTRQALLHLAVPESQILQFMTSIRLRFYAPFDKFFELHQIFERTEEITNTPGFSWIKISGESLIADRAVYSTQIFLDSGAHLVAIWRDGHLITTIDEQTSFQSGDLVGVLGSSEQISILKNRLQSI